jgi:hypothetical protein
VPVIEPSAMTADTATRAPTGPGSMNIVIGTEPSEISRTPTPIDGSPSMC